MRKILLFFNLILSTIEEKKVKLVYEHFRHGARFPESNLNSEKKDLFNVYHEFKGELTEVGTRMHYVEGYEIRIKYLNLFNSTNIFAQSTNSDRTIQSLNAHLLGMYTPNLKNLTEEQIKKAYPPNKFNEKDIKDKINEEIKKLELRPLPYNLQLIPVHILNPWDLKYSSTFCPHMKDLWNDNHKKNIKMLDNIVQETNSKYDKYFKHFFKDENFYFLNFDSLINYCDHYISDYLFNISIFDDLYKDGLNISEFYDHCQKISEYEIFNIYFANEKYLIYGNTPLVKDIIHFFNNKDKINSPKYKILSGHDSSIGSLQAYFKYVFKNEIKKLIYPEIATIMIIELYEKNNKEYIEYKVNNEILMNIEYEHFNDLINKNLISEEDLKKFCFKNKNTVLFILFLFFLVTIIVLIIYLLKIYQEYKQIKGNKIEKQFQKIAVES